MTDGTSELGQFAYDAYYAELLSDVGGVFPSFEVLSDKQANAWRAAARAVASEQDRRRERKHR